MANQRGRFTPRGSTGGLSPSQAFKLGAGKLSPSEVLKAGGFVRGRGGVDGLTPQQQSEIEARRIQTEEILRRAEAQRKEELRKAEEQRRLEEIRAREQANKMSLMRLARAKQDEKRARASFQNILSQTTAIERFKKQSIQQQNFLEKRVVGQTEEGIPITNIFLVDGRTGRSKEATPDQKKFFRKEEVGVIEAEKGEGLKGKELKLQRQREKIRTKKERGGKLTAKEEAILVGATVGAGIIGFGLGIAQAPKLIIDLIKNPKNIKKIPGIISREAKEFGRLLRVSPTEAVALIGTEIFLLKGTGKVLRVTGKLTGRARAVASIKFRRVKENKITIPSAKKGKTTTIRIGGTVKKLQEPLKEQVKLAGKKVTGVSAQADRIVNLLKTKRVVRKPIPDEARLRKSTKRLLAKFDRGRITKRELIKLDNDIRIQTKGAGSILERSFFADPRGRVRPSRLGLRDTKEASLKDILLGEDLTFRTNKPQILVFEDIRVQKFPKSLKNIEKKLKAGKTLTKSEAQKLIAFQTKVSGKFKPIGALSREPEITLAPGEIIKKVRTSAVTIINGRRVPIVLAKVIKAKPSTKKLIAKAKSGKITTVELKKLRKNLKKETGFKSSLSRRRGIRRRVRVPKPIIRRRPVKRRPVKRRPIIRKRPVGRPPARPSRAVPRRVVGRPPKRPARRPPARPPARPPVRPPARPPAKPPITARARARLKRKKARPKKPKKRAFNVFAKPIKKKKLVRVNKRPLTKTRARDLRNYITDTSLSRTAKIKPTKGKPKQPRLKVPLGYAKRTSRKFRRFRRVKGRVKALPKGKVIEKRRHLLDTKQEKRKISLARRIKQISKPKRRIKKRKGR